MNTTVPTYEQDDLFKRDLARLSAAEQRRFYAAVKKMVYDIKEGQGFRKSLRENVFAQQQRAEPGHA